MCPRSDYAKNETTGVKAGRQVLGSDGSYVLVIAAVEITPTTSASTAWCIRARTRFIHHKILSHEVGAVQFIYCLTRRTVVVHFNEAETPAALGEFIEDDLCRTNFAECFK